MAKIVKEMVAAIAFMVIGTAILASGASANSVGQCGGEVSTGIQLYHNWQHEGVAAEAGKLVAKPAGWKHMDGSLKSFMEKRVVRAKLARTAVIDDYGCRSGIIFGAGTRKLAKGESVMVALPKRFSKGNVSLKHRKGYKRIVAKVHVVGKVECSNPFKKVVWVVLYVKVKVVKREHHHRHKNEKHGKETCHSNSKNGGGGNCNHQETTVTAEQKCGAENHSTTGCIQETTTVVINCGNYSSENSGSVNQGGNCNNGGTETCVGQSNCNETHEETCVNDSCNETPPPKEEEKPCGCEPKPTIKITSMTELNQIPEGRTSQEVHIGTYASESGGVLTVDPGIGSVSACGSSTPKGTFTADVPSGSSEACVIFYAPEDGDEPEYMVVTVTACLGSLCPEKTQKVKITYPKRPS